MKYLRILLFLVFSSSFTQTALAHGARIDYQQTSSIAIRATYDDGTPMANAQAIIYAPDDPTTPWQKGMTDESGRFAFTPDPNLSGNWDVKIRQSGHGNIVSIPLAAGAISEQTKTVKMTSGSDYSFSQKSLMAIAIAWGCLGTALFFSRKPNNIISENSHL